MINSTATPMAHLAELAELDLSVEADGIGADPVALLVLAHEARDLGVEDVLVDVMVDEDEPAVARLRAYARVASQVAVRADYRGAGRLQTAC